MKAEILQSRAERTLRYLPKYLCLLAAICYTKEEKTQGVLEWNQA